MAITRALMKRQMYNMGGPTLEAGAPDLRLTGDQRNRGSYTQRRRAQMAGGGITNARQGYFLGGVTDFISDLIPNEIKDPIATFLPRPKLFTIKPHKIGPRIVANLPTVEYRP